MDFQTWLEWAEQEQDVVAEIIHAVPLNKANNLLNTLNASRGRITKNFRNELLSLVHHISPAVVSKILSADTRFFRPIINFWKSRVPSQQKRLPFGSPNELSLVPEDEPQQPAEPRQDKVNVDRMEYFPKSGSDLYHRLNWASQFEKMGRPLFNEIELYFLRKNIKSKSLSLDNLNFNAKQILNHYLTHGTRNLDEKQMNTLKSVLNLVSYSYIKSLAKGEITGSEMSGLIDHLIHEKIVCLRSDEIQALAGFWLKNYKPGQGQTKPRITEQTLKQMVDIFNNQKMHY